MTLLFHQSIPWRIDALLHPYVSEIEFRWSTKRCENFHQNVWIPMVCWSKVFLEKKKHIPRVFGGAKESGMMHFLTKWGAKEPQNHQNHRVDNTWTSWTLKFAFFWDSWVQKLHPPMTQPHNRVRCFLIGKTDLPNRWPTDSQRSNEVGKSTGGASTFWGEEKRPLDFFWLKRKPSLKLTARPWNGRKMYSLLKLF